MMLRVCIPIALSRQLERIRHRKAATDNSMSDTSLRYRELRDKMRKRGMTVSSEQVRQCEIDVVSVLRSMHVFSDVIFLTSSYG